MTPNDPPNESAASTPGALDRLLLCLIRLATERPFWVIGLSLAAAALGLWVTAERLTFKTGRSDLVAKDVPYIKLHEKYKAEFEDTQGMVVVVEGDHADAMKRFADKATKRFTEHPEMFSHVFHKIDTAYFESRALLYLEPEEIGKLGGEIESRQQFLTDVGMSPGLNQLLRSINSEISSGMVETLITGLIGTGEEEKEESKDDAADLSLLISLLDQATAHLSEGAVYRSPWSALFAKGRGTLRSEGYLTSDDESLMFILLVPNEDKTSFTGYQDSIELARRLIEETRREFPGVRVGLTGEDVIASDEMVTTQADVKKASLIALAGVSLLFIAAYRGVVQPLIAVFCLLVALAWSMGYTTLTVGHLNILSVVFTTILIGLGIDFGIHILERYREERSAGRPLGGALQQTVRGTGKGNFSGAVTTAIAFGAMTLTDFIGIAELGWIAAGGILFCFLAMVFLLPAMLVVQERMLPVAPRPRPSAQGGGVEKVFRRYRPILAVSLVLTLLSTVALVRVRFDYNLLHLQARGTEAVAYEMKIIEKAGRSAWSAASVAASLEEAVRRHRAMQALPAVGHVESIASVLPEEMERKLELIRGIAPVLGELHVEPEDTPLSLPSLLKTVKSIRFKLQGREEKSGESDSVRQANLSAARFLEAASASDPEVGKERLAAFSRVLFADYRDKIATLRASADPAPVRVEELPQSLRERYLSPRGKYLVVVYPGIDIWDSQARDDFLRQMREVDPEVAGNAVHMIESSRLMQQGYIHGGWYAMGAILIYVLAAFRRPLTTTLILLPVALGSLWTVGIMDLLSIRFNLANLVILPLILGIGVVNGIHIIHRYREEPDKSASVLSRSTGGAVVLSSLTTMIGFGAMMVADHQGIYSLGLVLTLGVFSCLAASVTTLPALLKWCSLKGWRV